MEVKSFTLQDDYKVSFAVDLPREEWTPYLERMSAVLQQKNPIRGFRTGTAPLALAEREYGDGLYSPRSQERR